MEKKDRRFAIGKAMLESGRMTSFTELMTILTISLMRDALGNKNHKTVLAKVFQPEKFTVEELEELARLMDCDPVLLFTLSVREHQERKDGSKS